METRDRLQGGSRGPRRRSPPTPLEVSTEPAAASRVQSITSIVSNSGTVPGNWISPGDNGVNAFSIGDPEYLFFLVPPGWYMRCLRYFYKKLHHTDMTGKFFRWQLLWNDLCGDMVVSIDAIVCSHLFFISVLLEFESGILFQ